MCVVKSRVYCRGISACLGLYSGCKLFTMLQEFNNLHQISLYSNKKSNHPFRTTKNAIELSIRHQIYGSFGWPSLMTAVAIAVFAQTARDNVYRKLNIGRIYCSNRRYRYLSHNMCNIRLIQCFLHVWYRQICTLCIMRSLQLTNHRRAQWRTVRYKRCTACTEMR